MSVPAITLKNGAEIPALGLGTWPMKGDEVAQAVRVAAECGYRLFDTAENYHNEEGVGQGIRESGLDRSEVFITTKFNREWHSLDGVQRAFAASCQRLGVDYIDLLMIHWPNPDHDHYVQAVVGLKSLLDKGSIRAIGTSNFKPAHLQRVHDETGIVPDVNQIQLSPYTTRQQSREFAVDHGITVESWSPIGGSKDALRSDPVITAIAARLGKTAVQVVLRWHHQLGLVTVPKSGDPERIAQNIAIFDFELTEADVASISGLDRGEQAATDSDAFGH